MSVNTIQEQGEANYQAMRKRVEAAIGERPAQEAQAAERSTAEVTRLVANLTGDETPLFVPSVHAVPVVADVENDGDRGPRPSVEAMVRRTLAAELEAFAASAPLDDVRVVAAMLRELPGLRLLATCEAMTLVGLRAAGDNRGMDPTTARETAVASLLSTYRAWQKLTVPSRLPMRTIGDYKSGLVSADLAKGGAK